MTKVIESKTLWVNVLAAIGLFVSSQFGYTISGAETGILMAAINAVLRAITKEPLEW